MKLKIIITAYVLISSVVLILLFRQVSFFFNNTIDDWHVHQELSCLKRVYSRTRNKNYDTWEPCIDSLSENTKHGSTVAYFIGNYYRKRNKNLSNKWFLIAKNDVKNGIFRSGNSDRMLKSIDSSINTIDQYDRGKHSGHH